jgi:pyruvyl transferase EpsO
MNTRGGVEPAGPHDADRAVFARRRASIDATFDRTIGRPRRVALLHYPNDGNAGNHMMWSAITEWLRDRGIRIGYAAHVGNLDLRSLQSSIGGDPILFLGGVTMSRLWPEHGATKRAVAAAFPDNRLVSLTSTMLFIDDDDEAAARGMFGVHRDVTLIARDPLSGEQARRVFGESVKVVVEHDSALRLDPIEPSERPARDVLWLRRDDAEGADLRFPRGVDVFDWPEIWDPMYRRGYFWLRTAGAMSRVRGLAGGRRVPMLNGAIAGQYRRASNDVVRAAADLLARHRVLVTDRMHPHILGALVGRHVVLLPDRYGKNRAVYEFSTSKLSTVHWADTADDAIELATTLAGKT